MTCHLPEVSAGVGTVDADARDNGPSRRSTPPPFRCLREICWRQQISPEYTRPTHTSVCQAIRQTQGTGSLVELVRAKPARKGAETAEERKCPPSFPASSLTLLLLPYAPAAGVLSRLYLQAARLTGAMLLHAELVL